MKPWTRYGWPITSVEPARTSGFPTWVPDTAVRPFSASVACVVNSSAISFNVEASLDFTGSSNFISSAATWLSL